MGKKYTSYIVKLLSVLIVFTVMITIYEHFNMKVYKAFNESFSSMTFIASFALSVSMYSLFGFLLYLLPNISNYKGRKLSYNTIKCIPLSAPIVVLLLFIGPGRYFKVFYLLSSVLGRFMVTLSSGYSSIILSVTLGFVLASCIESGSKEGKEE